MKKEKTILLDDNCIELISCDDVYRIVETTEEDGSITEEHELIKSDVRSRQTVLKSEIVGIRQVLNEYGNIRLNRTKIIFRYAEPITAEINYRKIQSILFENKHKNMGY